MATTCAPCIFGAAVSSFLTYPGSIEIITAQVATTFITAGNTTVTSVVTNLIAPVTTPAGGYDETSTYGPGTPVTWNTFGATLTWPTIYVDYQSFQGAAATSTGCASSLVPTPLALPAVVPQASLIYPSDSTGALPSGLLAYLDEVPAFITQLNNNPLTSCGVVSGNLPPTGGRASVTTTFTTTTPTTSTSTTTIPPPSTTTITGSVPTTVTATENASNAVTQKPKQSITQISISVVMISSSQTVSVVSGQFATLPGTSGTSITTYDASSMRSALSSKVSVASAMSSGVYTNSTTIVGATNLPPTVPPSRTSSIVSYTGAAMTQAASMIAGGSIAGLLGLALYL